MSRRRPSAILVAALLLPAGLAFGQGFMGPSTPRLSPHLAGQPPRVRNEPPATIDYKAATEKAATAAEDQPYSNDADRDFIASVLPHQQAAVDLATVELKYGKDPKARTMAQAVIDAQGAQIARMREWQAQQPK